MNIKIDNPSQWEQPISIVDRPTVTRQGETIRLNLAAGPVQVVIWTTREALLKMAGVLLLVLLPTLTLAQDSKPWLNKQTLSQLSIIGASYAADGLSTQSGRYRWSGSEINPLLGSNPSNAHAALYFTSAFSATVATSYMLRHHNRTRWLLTGAITATELYMTSHNRRMDHLALNRCLNNPLCSTR